MSQWLRRLWAARSLWAARTLRAAGSLWVATLLGAAGSLWAATLLGAAGSLRAATIPGTATARGALAHPCIASAQELGGDEILKLSKQGRTLPVEITAEHPLTEQRVRGDRGVDVLIDLAHQATFQAMWRLPVELRRRGFRASGSQATLNTVLAPGKPSRVRIHAGGRRPFAWWPNVPWDVVITFQASPQSQDYLPEEREALARFVREGGGLLIATGHAFDEEQIRQWSLNALLEDFGVSLSAQADRGDGVRVPSLEPDATWEILRKGEAGRPLVARRAFGKGRVVVFSSTSLFFWDDRAAEDAPRSRGKRMAAVAEAVEWAAQGAEPEAGTRRLPREASGGGPIYPELEQNVGGVVVYYAKNQKEELLRAVREDMPRAKRRIEAWLPSTVSEDPMYLIVSAGGGGGWAVNVYRPKEAGVISLSPDGLLSVFGHELAHTMGGPPNDRGEIAASWPHGNQGESHAGWFQGKINALFGSEEIRSQANRDCNRLFEFDETGRELDLAMDPAKLRERWGKGRAWTKIWWVWQKLDDRYGPTWYPRWRWVQHTRWQNQPDRSLTWDEMVEDMSIAVGEDLFPFFRRFGTTLEKDRFPSATFQDQTVELPEAPITATRAGPVCLEPIGDYRRPLRPRMQ